MTIKLGIFFGMMLSSVAFANSDPWDESTMIAVCKGGEHDWVSGSIHFKGDRYTATFFDNYDRTNELECDSPNRQGYLSCRGTWLVTEEPARLDLRFVQTYDPGKPLILRAKIDRSSLWAFKKLKLKCEMKK